MLDSTRLFYEAPWYKKLASFSCSFFFRSNIHHDHLKRAHSTQNFSFWVLRQHVQLEGGVDSFPKKLMMAFWSGPIVRSRRPLTGLRSNWLKAGQVSFGFACSLASSTRNVLTLAFDRKKMTSTVIKSVPVLVLSYTRLRVRVKGD